MKKPGLFTRALALLAFSAAPAVFGQATAAASDPAAASVRLTILLGGRHDRLHRTQRSSDSSFGHRDPVTGEPSLGATPDQDQPAIVGGKAPRRGLSISGISVG